MVKREREQFVPAYGGEGAPGHYENTRDIIKFGLYTEGEGELPSLVLFPPPEGAVVLLLSAMIVIEIPQPPPDKER